MVRRNTAGSWLDVVAGLLSKQNKRRAPRLTRRLGAELLEGRAVLSVAPVPVEVLDGGESLAQYQAAEHEMGPVIPAELAAPAESEVQDVAADQLFGVEQDYGYGEAAEGGEGEGEGSGSGSGGSGSGSGSGSGGGGQPEEPAISDTEVEVINGTLSVSGQVTDDGDPNQLSISLDGGDGTVTLNENGTFSVQITDPQANTTFTITITDADGNSTTYSFDYNP